MRVHFLSCRDFRTHLFTYPLRVFSKQLKDAGIEVHIYFDADQPQLTKCDVLAVISDVFGSEYPNPNPDQVVSTLKDFRAKVAHLIWCDVTDSTGSLHNEAFPYVDLYLKKQILKDRSLYTQPFQEYRYHLDYYYRHFAQDVPPQIREKSTFSKPLEQSEIDKFVVSWNLGLGDYHHFRGHTHYRAYWPTAKFLPLISAASNTNRPIQASYRAGMHPGSWATSFHRQKIAEQMGNLAKQGKYNVLYQGKVDYESYIREMTEAVVSVSPFGWGEICPRDFEAVLCGSIMFKPSMDHIDTWPNFYEENVTYVAHSWDFEDLFPKLTQILDAPDQYRHIAQAAQDRYLRYTSTEGGLAFASHLKNILDCLPK